jgi:flagellar hook capping protein FlgD
VRLAWRLSDAIGAQVTLERASPGEPRHSIATLVADRSDGTYEDDGVAAGRTYTYWLTAARSGEPSSVAGPVLVGIPADVGSDGAPRVLAISRIAPNPFSTAATFSVSLDHDGPFMVRVYRADGSLVRTLADTIGRAQSMPFTWDGTDGRGNPLAAGVYFFELRSGNRVRVQRAVLLR